MDYEEDSAYSYYKDKPYDEVTNLIEKYGSDEDLIKDDLNKRYPEDKYFVLIDYFQDNNGYFRIRVWKK